MITTESWTDRISGLTVHRPLPWIRTSRCTAGARRRGLKSFTIPQLSG
jgi:hypothetical protein